jgi:phospholipase C
MTDLHDPEAAERLAFEEPEAYLRRRDFLQRTATIAGLGVGAASLLGPETLVQAAAAKQAKTHLPGPRNLPIDTFVVLMMENRSFDHYLGWLPNADGRQAGLSYTGREGQTEATHRLTGDFQGCAFSDPDHSWEGGRAEFDDGKMTGFLKAGENDSFALGYYTEPDLPFIPSAARAFTTYDRFFCSLLASTYPNREYMHAAQSYGVKDNSIPQGGFPDTTIFASLQKAGVSNHYYYTDVPVSAFWGQAGLARSSQVTEYYERAAAGTLPHVSFVDPAFVGEEQGTSGDEHPHGDVRTGQAFMADVVHAFMESPQWKRGALFIVYDEWGGFFDHVKPPTVKDARASRDLNNDFGQMGFRIPAVAISPYVKRSNVNHQLSGFESILKLIEYRFGLKPLTVRDKYATNIGRTFDWDSKPRLELPDLPTPPAVISAACVVPTTVPAVPGVPTPTLPDVSATVPPVSTPSVTVGPVTVPSVTVPGVQVNALRAKPHDMSGLVTDGTLERLGFKYKPATPETVFREPSKVMQAQRDAQ